jgi:thymidylate synthase
MTIFTAEHQNALEAWQLGVKVLVERGGEVSNLLTTVHKPCEVDNAWLSARSPKLFKDGGDDIRDVANTIFPAKLAARATDRGDLYSKYLQRHDRTHRWARGRHAWGTYFERLVRFPPTGVNQLERVIEKLNNWPTRNTTGLVFHLSSPTVDAPRTRGGPCWHYGELLWNADGTIDLVAVYRNHDFFNKVLGNFIGLGGLLGFICQQSGKQPGKLVCHSVHAYHDSSQHALRALAA